MPRGGKRQGRTGANYGQRSDLQNGARLPVQAAPSQQYGERIASERAQQAVPLRRAASPVAAQRPAGGGQPPLTAAPTPLDAPTEFADEPVTAGSAFGAGPGVDALAMGRPQRLSDLLDTLGATGDLADMRVFARQRGL